MGYYVVVRRSSSRTYLGGFKARKGVTKKQLLTSIRRSRKPGMSYSIVTEGQFKKLKASKGTASKRPRRKAIRRVRRVRRSR